MVRKLGGSEKVRREIWGKKKKIWFCEERGLQKNKESNYVTRKEGNEEL